MTDYEKTWLRGAEGEMLTLTVYVPRAECIKAWQFFNETVLEFLAHRQIPYEINMTDHYGDFEREEVATFAQYCMANYHGVDSPSSIEAEGIRDVVMRDDAVFEHYREQLRLHKEASRKEASRAASAGSRPWK